MQDLRKKLSSIMSAMLFCPPTKEDRNAMIMEVMNTAQVPNTRMERLALRFDMFFGQAMRQALEEEYGDMDAIDSNDWLGAAMYALSGKIGRLAVLNSREVHDFFNAYKMVTDTMRTEADAALSSTGIMENFDHKVTFFASNVSSVLAHQIREENNATINTKH